MQINYKSLVIEFDLEQIVATITLKVLKYYSAPHGKNAYNLYIYVGHIAQARCVRVKSQLCFLLVQKIKVI